MKIRIGNDIRINLTIRGPLDYTFTNVKQIKCLLINECMTVGCDCCDGGKCPIEHRFPHEPFPQYYTPTPYTLNVCGHPRYHTDPWNCKACYHGFGGHFNDYHWWPGYHGFGLHPRKFIGDCCRFHMNHAMDIFYCDPRPCPHHHHCEPHCHCDCGIDKDFIYSAKATLMSGANKVQCIFPAYDQIMCGSYKLVLVVTTYEQGWGCRNLHTETIDYGTLFELVDDESGQLGSITIDADNIIYDDSTLGDISIASNNESPQYTFIAGTTVKMGTSDLNGDIWQVIGTTKDGRQVPYSLSWGLDELVFLSSNSDVISVDNNGTMTIGTPEEDTTVTITIIDSKNQSVSTSFQVLVKANGETGTGCKLWMQHKIYGEGWSSNESSSPINITLSPTQTSVSFKLVRLTKDGNTVNMPYTIKQSVPEDSMQKSVRIENNQSYLNFNNVYMNSGDTVKHCTFTYTNGSDVAEIEYIITKEQPIVPRVEASSVHVLALYGVDSDGLIYNPTIRKQMHTDFYIVGENMIDAFSDGFSLYEIDRMPIDGDEEDIEDHIINKIPFEVTSITEDTDTKKEGRIEWELNKTPGYHYYALIYDNAEYDNTKWDSEQAFSYKVLSPEEIALTPAGGMVTGTTFEHQSDSTKYKYQRGTTKVETAPGSDIYYYGCELSTDYGEIDVYAEVIAHKQSGDYKLISGLDGILEIEPSTPQRIIRASDFNDAYCISVRIWSDYDQFNDQVDPIGDCAIEVLYYKNSDLQDESSIYYNDPRFQYVANTSPASGNNTVFVKDCSQLNKTLHQGDGITRVGKIAVDGNIMQNVTILYSYDSIEGFIDYIVNEDDNDRYESHISTETIITGDDKQYITIDGVDVYPILSTKANTNEQIWHIGFVIANWDNRTSDVYTTIPDFIKGHNINMYVSDTSNI